VKSVCMGLTTKTPRHKENFSGGQYPHNLAKSLEEYLLKRVGRRARGMNKKILLFLAIITISNTVIYGQCQTEQSAIAFPDPNLEAVIREAIGKPEGAIYASDLNRLEFLDASGNGIENITGLEYCINLENLSLKENEITDVSPLSGLNNLTVLDLSSNEIADASLLNSLINLKSLNLSNNQITDASKLSNLTSLESLNLSGNQVLNVSMLSGMVT